MYLSDEEENDILLKHTAQQVTEYTNDNNNAISLKFDLRFKNDQHFLKMLKWKEINFIENLWVSWINGTNETGIKDLNEFLNNPSINEVKNFWFNYFDDGFIELNNDFNESLKNILETVTNEVYIHAWILDQSSLENIFKSSHNALSLWFDWCQIGELNENLDLNSSLIYKITEIYLVGTAVKDDLDYIESTKFKLLINALKKVPSLLENLKVIKVDDNHFPIKDFDVLNTSRDSNSSQTDTVDESQPILSDFHQLKIEHSEFVEPLAYK